MCPLTPGSSFTVAKSGKPQFFRWSWRLGLLANVFGFACSPSLGERTAAVIPQADELWCDTFGDDTQIAAATQVARVTDNGVSEGNSFVLADGNPLLTLESSDPWDAQGDVTLQIPGAVHPDVQYFPEGIDGYKYWMIFTPFGSPPSDIPPPPVPGTERDWWWERNTLVRSNDGIHWVKTEDYQNPLLVPGPDAWDAAWHADPDFTYAPGQGPGGESWFLYWTGCGEDTCRVGVAVSNDGKHYTKVGPIMPGYTRDPTVVYDPEQHLFHLWYGWGTDEVAYATSQDGVHYTPYDPLHPDAPQWGYTVLSPKPGTYDQGGISHMDVIRIGGLFHMYYLGQPTNAYAGLVVGHAVSPDGIQWTRPPAPVVTPAGQVWQFTSGLVGPLQTLYRPSAVRVDGTVHLYYCGSDSYSAYPVSNIEVGLAYSLPVALDGHLELAQQILPVAYAPRPDTVAWYHFDENPAAPPPQPTYSGEYAAKDQTLAWYHFNEPGGSTTADEGGILQDTGTLDGATFTGGLYGNALSFDGASRMTVAESTELNPQDELTIEAWVYPLADQSNNYIAVKMTPGAQDAAYGLKLESFYAGYSEIGAFIADTSGVLHFAYGGHVSPGTWTHVAMTYHVGDPHLRLYQDGLEVAYRYGAPGQATDPISPGTQLRQSPGALHVGVLPLAGPLYYRGRIDEFRLLGRALPPEEIAADGSGAASPSLVMDASGNDHHGLRNGPVTSGEGRIAYAVQLDGAGSIAVPYSDGLNTSDGLTIEAWVFPSTDKPNNYVAIRLTPGSTDSVYGLKLENTYTGSSEIGGWITAATGVSYFSYGGRVPLGQWTHVAMTYEPHPTEPTRVRLYQDGREVIYRYASFNNGTDAVPAGTAIRTKSAPLTIGAIAYGSLTSRFEGRIDELRILGHTLTERQLLADAGAGFSTSGEVLSVVHTPPAGTQWLRFEAQDEQPEATQIVYSILDENGAVLLRPAMPGADISSLGSVPIRLRAELMTGDPALTPLVYQWCLQTGQSPAGAT